MLNGDKCKGKNKMGKKRWRGYKSKERRKQAMWLSEERHSKQKEYQKQRPKGGKMLIMFKEE